MFSLQFRNIRKQNANIGRHWQINHYVINIGSMLTLVNTCYPHVNIKKIKWHIYCAPKKNDTYFYYQKYISVNLKEFHDLQRSLLELSLYLDIGITSFDTLITSRFYKIVQKIKKIIFLITNFHYFNIFLIIFHIFFKKIMSVQTIIQQIKKKKSKTIHFKLIWPMTTLIYLMCLPWPLITKLMV